jgi:CubicO group peptidase (beta-lactamase class C family)
MSAPEIHGTVVPGFERVRDAFAANWEHVEEVGAGLAVTVDGEPVVDLWAGTATYDDGPGDWHDDTIINVWSTTKTMSFLCMLVLVERGLLDLYEPVATYWPEFAANGKERIATRHILSHTAGLPGWDEPLRTEDLLDHDKLVTLLAAQAPWWEPGTQSGYHAISQGYLLAEILRRIDGRTMGRFFAEEVAGPLGADFHIGTGPEHDHRIAHVIPPSAPLNADDAGPDSIAVRTVSNPRLRAEYSSTPEWRRAEIPAAGGHGNARAVARVHSAIARGGAVDGIRLLSPDTIDRIFDVQYEGPDLMLPLPVKLGMGFGLPGDQMPAPNPRTCFWGGWGGSLAVIDVDARVSYAYVMNKMFDGTTGDLRAFGPLLATFAAVS